MSVRRFALVPLLVALTMTAAGCNKHHVAATHPCPKLTNKVVVSGRSGIGMPRMGLTPQRLKALQNCD
jgi:hypothetical protein